MDASRRARRRAALPNYANALPFDNGQAENFKARKNPITGVWSPVVPPEGIMSVEYGQRKILADQLNAQDAMKRSGQPMIGPARGYEHGGGYTGTWSGNQGFDMGGAYVPDYSSNVYSLPKFGLGNNMYQEGGMTQPQAQFDQQELIQMIFQMPTYRGGLAKLQDTNWTVYNTSNSLLPYNYVNSIAIDKLGYKWIGTQGGISKFDGNNWLTYNASNSGLHSNYILSLAVEGNKCIWASTSTGGIAKAVWEAPLIDFTADTVCLPGDTTYFINKCSKTDIFTKYVWDIGNDGTIDFTTPNPVYLFPAPGVYPVKLTATNMNCCASVTKNVVAGGAVRSVEHNDRIQTFTSDRTDEMFHARGLPGRTRRDPEFLELKSLGDLLEF